VILMRKAPVSKGFKEAHDIVLSNADQPAGELELSSDHWLGIPFTRDGVPVATWYATPDVPASDE